MNPNRTRSQLQNTNLNDEHQFPLLTRKLVVEKFRNISQLDIEFIHPITVLSGTNKIGKTSIMTMLACSHVDFQMRNVVTGQLERCTWSRLIRFTQHDDQAEDWKYKITYKRGRADEEREGRRLSITKKWSGVAKKESQIEDRRVVYIDVDRINPARACSNVLFMNTQASTALAPLNARIGVYFEYIFEIPFSLSQIATYQNKTSFKFNNTFTNFNSASGEDVLLSILLDAVQADRYALILIDELELGLHPKIQRRLIDVLMDIAQTDQKQFIVTTHSPFLLSGFDQESRIFIEKKNDGNYRAIPKISVNAAFSKMDSEIFPLVDLFCEDKESVNLINKALEFIRQQGYQDIHKIVNIVPSGSASQVKENYDVFKRTWGFSKINIGYMAVFDGDQRAGYSPVIGADDKITFLFSEEAPEKFLLRYYLSQHVNATLQWHLDNTNPHVLFAKCVEEGIAGTEMQVFEQLYNEIQASPDYQAWLIDFQRVIIDTCTFFSEKL